jgi:hypothetical protein
LDEWKLICLSTDQNQQTTQEIFKQAMVGSRRNWQLAAFAEDMDKPNETQRLKTKLDSFVGSLSNVLDEITAIEINTAIVEEIVGDEFVPWQVYRDLYPISRDYLERSSIHISLRDRYLTLRKKLEFEYALILTDPHSDLYEAEAFSELRNDFPILTDEKIKWEEIKTKLPSPFPPSDPEHLLKVQKLLSDSRFLRKLRKIGELKLLLDSRNKTLLKQEQKLNNVFSGAIGGKENEMIAERMKNVIYAQTTIQLDGNIVNRYSQEVLNSPHQDLLLEIHKHSIQVGERQWRGLFNFAIEMIQKMLEIKPKQQKVKTNTNKVTSISSRNSRSAKVKNRATKVLLP